MEKRDSTEKHICSRSVHGQQKVQQRYPGAALYFATNEPIYFQTSSSSSIGIIGQ